MVSFPCWPIRVCLLALVVCASCSEVDLDPKSVSSAHVPLTASVAKPPSQTVQPEEYVLPESEREFLWELEHHGNLLGRYGFQPFGRALRLRDAEALNRLLAADFSATIFRNERRIAVEADGIAVCRREPDDEELVPMDRGRFVAWLLDQRSLFADDLTFQFGVSKLSPISRDAWDGRWRARCRLRLQGTSSSGWPAELELALDVETDRPTKERLEAGAWLSSCAIRQVRTATSRAPLFDQVAEARGLPSGRLHDNWKNSRKVQNTGGIYACDYNRDGCVDLLITDCSLPGTTFYRGTPSGTFEDATHDLADVIGGVSPIAAFADIDNDGWEDLLFVDGPLLHNQRGSDFTNVTGRTNLFHLLGEPASPQSRSITGFIPADYDRDGLIDLYVTRSDAPTHGTAGSWLEETRSDVARNQLLRNLGNWQFEDVTQATRTDGGGRSAFSAVWLDANNDLWPDLYVINEFGDGVLLVHQQDGTFGERMLADGPTDFGAMGVTCGDVDNDAQIDLYVASMYSKAGSRVMGNMPHDVYPPDVMRKLHRLIDGSELYRNRGNLTFERCGAASQVHDVGWAWGAALTDLDNDGWLDLYATAGYMSRDRSKPDG